MCGAHAAVRTLVGEMVEQYDRPTVIDMEAGLEHLSRGTVRNVDCLLIVIEPYFKSMETGARMNGLAKELGVEYVYCIANKVRGAEDESAIRDFCSNRDMALFGVVPNDESLLQAERQGVAPLDHEKECPAVLAIARIAEKLFANSRN
ncbi:MAG: hypothetical protein ACE5IY_18495 [bacterium]